MCAHVTWRARAIEGAGRFAPAKLIPGYSRGIIVFAFHLSCLHICLHPSASLSFRLTRLRNRLAIRPPFSRSFPSFLLTHLSTFLSSTSLLFLGFLSRLPRFVRQADALNCSIKSDMYFPLQYVPIDRFLLPSPSALSHKYAK